VNKHVAILVWFGVLILTGWSCCCINSLAQADRDTLIIGEPPTIVALLVDEPQPDTPPIPVWESAAYSMGVGDDHVVAVRAVVETTGVAGAFLLAVGKLESHNQHYTPGGAVKRGDGGRAIGWGQVHRSPWQKWAAGELDREIDLDVLEDNVLVAAMILQRGGYDAADEATWEPAAAYYNTGKHLKSTSYSRAVMKQYAMIKDGE